MQREQREGGTLWLWLGKDDATVQWVYAACCHQTLNESIDALSVAVSHSAGDVVSALSALLQAVGDEKSHTVDVGLFVNY